MAATHVALLRGINVGKSNQVAMSDLLTAFERFDDVSTLLRSGNVLFRSPRPLAASAIIALEDDIATATGVQARVLVFAAADFVAISEANPLLDVSTDDSRLATTFLEGPPPAGFVAPAASGLAPEQVVVTDRAVYQWSPDGLSKSKVPLAWWRRLGPAATTRNQKTVDKLVALLT